MKTDSKSVMFGLTVSLKNWDRGFGFQKTTLAKPVIDESKQKDDSDMVIVKTHLAGVCGTDRGIWQRQVFGDLIKNSLKKEGKDKRTIGHELYGEVVAAGSKTDLKIGQMVAAESHATCGSCYQCLRGERHVCTNEKIMGISFDGCFAQFVKLPAQVLWPTNPETIRAQVAVLQEPFGNAVHATTKLYVRNQRIAILGCGPIGLMSILIAQAYGARQIIAVDPLESNRRLAKKFGANQTLATQTKSNQGYDGQLVKEIERLTDGVGADIALEMAGYQISVNNAIRAVRRGGNVILFGLKAGDSVIKNFDQMIVRGVTLHSIIGRQLFKNWHISQALLEDRANGIQDHLWNGLLKKGKGTIVPFDTFEPKQFETHLTSQPKILLKFV